jgi:hypothetical protein
MAQIYSVIDEGLRRFIEAQHLFFVATAPSDADGHLNLSPKGLDGFRILGPTQVAYLDYPGSGVETVAHLRDDGRIVILFCAFAGPPKILRLYGRGRVLEPQDPQFSELLPLFSPKLPARSLIVIELDRIADACGYGVPRYDYVGERQQLPRWAEKKGESGLHAYQLKKNESSIDGLPGLLWARDEARGAVKR